LRKGLGVGAITRPAVQEKYRYSGWGVVTHDIGFDLLASLTGKGYDAAGLIYFNARWYDPELGRFITEDPARAGADWYEYTDNNPLRSIDPWGLDNFAAVFDKDTSTMTATYTPSARDVGATAERSYSYSWTATSNPSTKMAKTMPSKENYYPQSFPTGEWNLEPSVPEGNSAFGPAAVPTNASQTVTTYTSVTVRGQTTNVPSGSTVDKDYDIHGGGYSYDQTQNNDVGKAALHSPAVGNNNVSDKTLGCIRMTNTGVKELATLSDAALKSGGKSTLNVPEDKKK
jgi:RHS repeat-associated protein